MLKNLLRLLGAAFGTAFVAAAGPAWDIVKGVLSDFGATFFTSGTVEGVIAYGLITVAIFAGGWLVSLIPKKA